MYSLGYYGLLGVGSMRVLLLWIMFVILWSFLCEFFLELFDRVVFVF